MARHPAMADAWYMLSARYAAGHPVTSMLWFDLAMRARIVSRIRSRAHTRNNPDIVSITSVGPGGGDGGDLLARGRAAKATGPAVGDAGREA